MVVIIVIFSLVEVARVREVAKRIAVYIQFLVGIWHHLQKYKEKL